MHPLYPKAAGLTETIMLTGNGDTLIAAGFDNTIQLWRVPVSPGRERCHHVNAATGFRPCAGQGDIAPQPPAHRPTNGQTV